MCIVLSYAYVTKLSLLYHEHQYNILFICTVRLGENLYVHHLGDRRTTALLVEPSMLTEFAQLPRESSDTRTTLVY